MYFGPRIHDLKKTSREAQGYQTEAHKLGIRLPITIHDFQVDFRRFSAHQIRVIMRQIQRLHIIPDSIKSQLETHILQAKILTAPVDNTRLSSFSSVRSFIMDLQEVYLFAKKAGLPTCMEACRKKAADVISAYTQRAQSDTRETYLSDRRKAGIIKELTAFFDFSIVFLHWLCRRFNFGRGLAGRGIYRAYKMKAGFEDLGLGFGG